MKTPAPGGGGGGCLDAHPSESSRLEIWNPFAEDLQVWVAWGFKPRRSLRLKTPAQNRREALAYGLPLLLGPLFGWASAFVGPKTTVN